jgi:hypothetical protein
VVVIPIMIVIMIVPIMLCMPAVPVFIPPFMELAPAIFACLMQLVARMLRLWTVPSVMLSSFVKPVVGPYKAMTASVVVRHSSWSRSQQQKSPQRGQCKYSLPDSLHTSDQKTLHEFFPPRSAQG